MAAPANASSFVERGSLRFLMIDCPTNANLDAYIKDMKAHNVTDLAHACEAPYDGSRVASAGIRMHRLVFVDGDAPPPDIIDKWLEVVAQAFGKGAADKRPAVAVHCVAGLGRTAVLVAIALIEDGVEPLDAVAMIRAKRRGAINAKQLVFLQGYKKRKKGGCAVM